MSSLASSIGTNARKAYENKIKVTNAGYGSTFKPIEFGTSESSTVTIQKPDGTTGTIPRTNLAAAVALGAKEVK
jgi:hypothetical protein